MNQEHNTFITQSIRNSAMILTNYKTRAESFAKKLEKNQKIRFLLPFSTITVKLTIPYLNRLGNLFHILNIRKFSS